MFYSKKNSLLLVISLSLVTSLAQAQPNRRGCGDLPIDPDLVDGSAASLDELVENSKAVNKFIEDADKYLDCQDGMSKFAKNMPEDMQVQRATIMTVLLNRRNAIGDEFNAEVAKYREANPE